MAARLIIVDDHEVVRLGVRSLFANHDSFEICGEAENGMDAIRMVQDLLPDVVILDLSMPGMNGFETAEKILTIAPAVRIIFFSAHEIPATARWVGAAGFVSKSSALDDLILAVSQAARSRDEPAPRQKSASATNTSQQ